MRRSRPMSLPAQRIVLVLDGPRPPRWQERALAAISQSSSLELAEVRLIDGPRRGWVRRAHGAIERRLFALGPDALEPVALDGGPAQAPGAPRSGSRELVVWLAEGAPPAAQDGDLLRLRHGRRYEPAEEAFRRAVLGGEPCVVTEAVLQRAGRTLLVERTVSGARPYSTTLSRDKALWKIAALVARAAERAAAARTDAPPDAAPSPAPTTAELIFRSPLAWARIVGARLLFVRPWQIRVRVRRGEPTAGWTSQEQLLRWRDGHLYADPMLFEHGGAHHLFCEDLPLGSGRAVISHVELGAGGAPGGPPQPVLERPYHLSYPFVFEHRGEVFMIPESSAERRVELYRASRFPDEWQLEAVLLDGLIASDATLLEENGRLWLFVCVAVTHATMLDELHLFSAAELTGPWVPHPLNPVVSDVSRARPAGAILRWGSQLVRPGQDCSRRYGGAVTFQAIDELSPEGYAEHEIARLDPGDVAGRATHTYASDGAYEAIDLRRRRLRPMRPNRPNGP